MIKIVIYRGNSLLEIISDEQKASFYWCRADDFEDYFWFEAKMNAALILNHIVMFCSAEIADLLPSFLQPSEEI